MKKSYMFILTLHPRGDAVSNALIQLSSYSSRNIFNHFKMATIRYFSSLSRKCRIIKTDQNFLHARTCGNGTNNFWNTNTKVSSMNATSLTDLQIGMGT